MNQKIFTLTIIILLAGSLSRAAAPADLTVNLQPEHIRIGAGYNGEKLTITGEIPSDATALIRVTGDVKDYKLKQKGRALGLLWMNLGSVEVSNVPELFLLYLPEASQGTGQNEQTPWQTLDIGLAGVRKQAHIVAEDKGAEALFEEFVKLKQKTGLYAVTADAIHFKPQEGGMKSFNAVLTMPSALPQGTFTAEVFAIKNNAVIASAARTIDAFEVGMPAWISTLAFDHGTLYGLMAVLIAVMAGFLTGIMFKDQKGAH